MGADEIKLGVEIIVFLGGLFGIYYKLKYDSKKNSDDIKSIKDDLKSHEELTSNFMKSFNCVILDIEKIKAQDKLKEEYQQEIINKVLTPIIQEMNASMKSYVDVKTGVIAKEIEAMKVENMTFKSELREYIKELKDENSKAIDRIVEVLKK